ncbi:metalloendopeptidase OMA1, mitochondrial-like [Anneissia japonica]|uniref:metalloendopeptidase OMA1, mitochondrial-like n=1 Tax=Anneissia japonica TaxID=1529436 RepID=UPI001425AC90|nr:metalloendopeptidase OMA1, mitochondrial-like [Anneissia japonica]
MCAIFFDYLAGKGTPQDQCRQYEHRFIDSHELFHLVDKVASQLIKCNQHLPEIKNRTWVVHIVDDPKQKNAFVLPNGHIFVFTGMLLAVMNEHQLGIVLAHEIAHVVLNHGAEQASFLEFFDWLMIVVLAGFWAFLPNDGIAIIATWFKNRVAELLIQMPYSRSLEVEADVVGLELAANSCFDVRESQVFWELMADASQRNDEVQMEWLSTHPTHEHRAKHLEELIPKAIKMREFCKCPALPKQDPRLLLKSLKAQQDEISKEPRTVVVPGVVINASND